jgi:hypothetical protein
VVRLSALFIGFLYTPGDIPGTISVSGWVDPRATAWPDFVNEKYQWHHWELNPKPFSLQCSASTTVPVHTDVPNMDTTYYKSMFWVVFNSCITIPFWFLLNNLCQKNTTEQVTTLSSTFVTYLCFKLNICSHTSFISIYGTQVFTFLQVSATTVANIREPH